MNNKIILFILVFMLSVSFVFSLENMEEQLTKNEIFSKIDIEHKNTRKYISDELTRQREQFYKDIDDRGAYYEKEANSLLSTMFWKLGLIIGGVMLFTVGMSHIMRLKTERVRFAKLEKYLLDGLVVELSRMAKNQNKPSQEMRYPTENIKPVVITEKVEELMQENARKTSYDKLNSTYKEKGIKKPDNNINIGEHIRI